MIVKEDKVLDQSDYLEMVEVHCLDDSVKVVVVDETCVENEEKALDLHQEDQIAMNWVFEEVAIGLVVHCDIADEDQKQEATCYHSFYQAKLDHTHDY